jgi:PAS domain S-box-containing protein
MASVEERLQAVGRSVEIQSYLETPDTGAYIVRRDPGHDGIIMWASPSMRDVLGYRPKDLVGRNAWDVLLAKDDVVPASDYSARMSEGDLLGWAPLVHHDGRKSWFRFDALNRSGGVVLIVRPEPDAREHYFHAFGRPSPDAT